MGSLAFVYRGERSFGQFHVTCGQHVQSLTVIGILDQDYCKKLVAIQILHGNVLALIRPAGGRIPNRCVRSDSASVSQRWATHGINNSLSLLAKDLAISRDTLIMM